MPVCVNRSDCVCALTFIVTGTFWLCPEAPSLTVIAPMHVWSDRPAEFNTSATDPGLTEVALPVSVSTRSQLVPQDSVLAFALKWIVPPPELFTTRYR